METTDTLEIRLQRRMHVSLYALLFLTTLLGFSVLLDGCTYSREVKNTYVQFDPSYALLEGEKDCNGVQSMDATHEISALGLQDDETAFARGIFR